MQSATPPEDPEVQPTPSGSLALQIVALPADTNADGDLYGGWLVRHMDLAGSTTAQRVARGRVATVAIDAMVFLRPVLVGSTLSFYTRTLETGRSSMAILVEVWASLPGDDAPPHKVTESQFTFVAIDADRRTRPLPRHTP